MSETVVLFFLTFFLGASIGSFLHAWSSRMHKGESILTKRSHCDSCKHSLNALDLFPLLSFILLKGKCRYCQAPLSKNHLFVEGATGFLFALAAYRALFGIWIPSFVENQEILLLFFRDITVISSLVFVFLHDTSYRTIPDSIVIPGTSIALFLNILLGLNLKNLFLGIGIATGFFGLQYLLSKGKAIGQGDITLGLFIGATLGFPETLIALTLAYIFGAIVALFLLTKKTYKRTDEIPLGSFLAIATLVTLFFGEKITAWYLALL